MRRFAILILASLALTAAGHAQSPSPTNAAQVQPAVTSEIADDNNTDADIVVIGDNGEANALSADSLRDAAQAFQRHRSAFAPNARFVFQIDPVAGQALDSLGLRLRSNRRNRDGGRDSIDLDVNEAGEFELPVAQVLNGDWALRSAVRGRLSIRPLIISPGGTRFNRRFGDARLQCRVFIAFTRLNIAMRALAGAANVCNRSNVALYMRTPRPIAAVAITGWTQPIDIRADRMSFRVPLHERAISNEARITVRFQ